MIQTVHNLGKKDSLLNEFIREIRDENIQQDRLRFRTNLQRIGNIMAYEISKVLKWKNSSVTSPLGTTDINILKQQPVLVSIMRAALPMHQGFIDFFDHADNGFISAYRQPISDEGFEIKLDYISCPDLNDKDVILIDPMLATGSSIVVSIQELIKRNTPKHIHIVTAISCSLGIDHIRNNVSEFTLWTAAIDEELTAKSYIVPGLGDAGDLAFGNKD